VLIATRDAPGFREYQSSRPAGAGVRAAALVPVSGVERGIEQLPVRLARSYTEQIERSVGSTEHVYDRPVLDGYESSTERQSQVPFRCRGVANPPQLVFTSNPTRVTVVFGSDLCGVLLDHSISATQRCRTQTNQQPDGYEFAGGRTSLVGECALGRGMRLLRHATDRRRWPRRRCRFPRDAAKPAP
jgi:hypothetical protein